MLVYLIFIHASYCHIFQCAPALKSLSSYYWNTAFCQCIQSLQLACHGDGYDKKAYILKYQLDFKNNLINNGCATLYHLSMTCITVYNLSINSNYRILAAELNYRFTNYTLNILVFLYWCWWQIILGTFSFFFTGGQVADTYHMFTKYSK